MFWSCRSKGGCDKRVQCGGVKVGELSKATSGETAGQKSIKRLPKRSEARSGGRTTSPAAALETDPTRFSIETEYSPMSAPPTLCRESMGVVAPEILSSSTRGTALRCH